jgi:hypothetical protein
VTPVTFNAMFDIEPAEMDEFCTSCCREQITDVYTKNSDEMTRFNLAIKDLKSSSSSNIQMTMPIDPFDGRDRADQVYDWNATVNTDTTDSDATDSDDTTDDAIDADASNDVDVIANGQQ